MKRILVFLLALLAVSAHARNQHGGAHPPQSLGINLGQLEYFATEQPFLNIMKSGGASTSYGVGWFTSSNGTFPDTGEEAYVQLDSDGYPTTLTASPTPPGGQVFTSILTLINFNTPGVAPGAPSVYPSGQYRLKFEGKGTVVVSGDASVSGGDTCTGSGTLTNAAANTYASCTLHLTSGTSSGIILGISAVNDSVDHPRDISLVLQSNVSAYDAGGIFSPTFTAMLAPFSSLRFMEWENTNQEFSGGSATGSISSGATSLTLSSADIAPTGTYHVVFIDGEQRDVSLTLNSTAVTWTGGLSNTISNAACPGFGNWEWGSQCYFVPFFFESKSWATRPKPSNAFWDNAGGIPLEVAVALCNQIGADCHVNVPLLYSDSDIAAMGQLVMSGTGMQGGFSGLSSTRNATFELSNETWNCGTFSQCDVEASLGGFTWPAQPSGGGNSAWQHNYHGMRTAQMATDLQTAVGGTIFARVNPTLAGQVAGTGSVTDDLTTAYWSGGPASAAPIKSIAVAPYWGGNPGGTDCTTMTGVATPLDDFFATLTGQTGTSANGGHTYTSIPSGGWLGQTNGWTASYVSLMPTYPALKLIAYEGGDNFYACALSGGACDALPTCTGWPALVASAERDVRMGAAILAQQNWWKTNVGGAQANVFNFFQDVGAINQFGSYGLLESIMQPISPLLSAPAKYIGAAAFVQ